MYHHLFNAALGTIGLLLGADLVSAQAGNRQPASPGYAGRNPCPFRCSVSGPNPANWSLYHNFGQVQSCPETLFYDFSLYDQVDNSSALHRIYACTSFGPDWVNFPELAREGTKTHTINATYEIGGWSDGQLAAADIRTLAKQMRHYLVNGFGSTTQTVLLFAQSGQASAGLYIGKGLQNEGIGSFALKTLEDSINNLDNNSSALGMQLCEKGYDSDDIFGFISTSNATFTTVQDALKSWSKAECLSFRKSGRIMGPALITTPAIILANATNTTAAPFGSHGHSRSRRAHLVPRADCRTIQVNSGDGCAALAQRCGISAADFTKYNPGANFCASLVPMQKVCCSAGTIPKPKPNPDGSCATYQIHSGDSCAAIAASNGISTQDIENFNKKTWAWNGCANLWVGTIICLTTGSPPMPAPVANALCGPQVPGTKAPADMSTIAQLNPCPLNACCDVWGQCGTTPEFCTDTNTGAPGTAKPGTNGCISNCGTDVVKGASSSVFRSIAYFEGYGLSRSCLYQDALQIDASKYTHLHFAFGTITADYQVTMADILTTYEFENFKRIQGPAKILSFGGWDFSTSPSTYNIFRQGVAPANQQKLATNVANFIKSNNLDGVDIDWEYPGAPDIPNIPPGDKADGTNYLAFLTILKGLLPGKSVSIAAPASYWYLRSYPIAQISKVVDYIVFMTYDLHGQWDAQNPTAQIGCPSGMCLRSAVNLTETVYALAMITKAGVPSNQVVAGVASYGRSFAMADANCYGSNCFYTGAPFASNAKKGPCTDTAGYISNAEIGDILKNSSRVNQNYFDSNSNSNILVYDNNQWVGWMTPEVRASRTAMYKSYNLGGTTNWASDLESYNDPPGRSGSWANFIVSVKSGLDGYQLGNRTGNWTTVTCTDQSVEDKRTISPSERWNMIDAPDAWTDIINVFKTYDRPNFWKFTTSISNTIHVHDNADCGSLKADNNCGFTKECTDTVGAGSGPAGYFIWNSIVQIHEMYASYYDALTNAAAKTIDNSLQAFEDKFAPVPPPPDDSWLQILMDLVGMGSVLVAGPFFNSWLSQLPYFLGKEGTVANLKDSTIAVLASGTSIAKDLISTKELNGWTDAKQHEFSAYMGQTITLWGMMTELALAKLFNGTDEDINQLTNIIADGKFIDGGNRIVKSQRDAEPGSETALEAMITKSFFAYAIPAIWAVSKTGAFIADSGYACGTVDPLKSYMTEDTMHKTWGCYQDKLYYLVAAMGDAESCSGTPGSSGSCTSNLFSAPPGIEWLDGSAASFGGVTISDLITGSVRSYIQNGNTNGIGPADPSNPNTATDYYNKDVTTPGFIRIPVCSPDVAYKAWDGPGGPSSDPHYPCSIPKGTDDCGDSTFEDQTSDASPTVSDCLQIVKNIQGTGGEWEVENAIGNQHQLVQFGTCNFGVQGKGKDGNIDFHVGSQDIVDIILDSISKFGGSGKVGSKGDMSCRGDVKGQDVEWGLY